MPVAHWYSSGGNRWCSARSSRVTWTGALRSARAANKPASPPPTITTRREPDASVMAHSRPLVASHDLRVLIAMVVARESAGIALKMVLPARRRQREGLRVTVDAQASHRVRNQTMQSGRALPRPVAGLYLWALVVMVIARERPVYRPNGGIASTGAVPSSIATKADGRRRSCPPCARAVAGPGNSGCSKAGAQSLPL